MTRFYQGLIMAAIVLSAGIIGQLDAAQEMERRQEMRAETARHEQASDRNLSKATMKTAMAERAYQLP